MKPPDRLLSVISQTLILDLGRTLEAWQQGDGRIADARQEPGQTVTERLDAMVARIVQSVGEDVAARGMLGLRRKMDSERRRMRVCVVAYIAWQHLRHGNARVDIGDLASTIADPCQPVETLLHARHEIGLMIADKVVIGVYEDGRAAFAQVIVPIRTLVWLSGGQDSMGFLTYRRAAQTPPADSGQGESDAPQASKPMPSARQLFEQVRKVVLNCDPQLKVLASRLVLAATRAAFLSKGVEDSGVGVQNILIFGSSGSGKTWAVEQICKFGQIEFYSTDGSCLSGEGWAGGKVEDIFRGALSANTNGERKGSKQPIVFCWDEIDKVLRANSAEHVRSIQSSFLRPLGGNKIVVGGKRMTDGPPLSFDCNPHCYIFSGVFDGLSELAKQPNDRREIGFQCAVTGEKRHADIRRGLVEYGCLDEIANRFSAFIRMPDPTRTSISQAIVSAQGIVDGYNKVLASREIVLLPMEPGVDLLADYGFQTKSYYRGAKHLLGTIVEELLFDGTTGLVVIDKSLVKRAIDRANGDADADKEMPPSENKTNDQQHDECEVAPLAGVG